ncbi:hypothetical protein CDV31_001866 [Fusarium ambrosium]|uniref:DUF7924 domain-containing protein n=1 Tax=Fusarium ambrosium TaxID=131363 RepID=A0A428UY99_9HYPO|nr:hypothetical protein CDV31_001866 [Fusarium ambrosium]
MARSQNPKQQRTDETSRADVDTPPNKIKTRSEAELEAWESWEYPPEFYDRLSKINLTHRALRELDRRTRTRRSRPASPIRHALSRTATSRELARFARHGGPDLRHLRGYPHPPIDMGASQKTKSTDPTSTPPTSATTTKKKKSTPYNRDFDLHLTDHAIHPAWKSREPDLEDLTATLAVPRPSLSPSHFSDGAFKAFKKTNLRAKDEADVLANVIPTILGPSQTSRFCARDTVFTNLEPLTDGKIAAPKPDIYFGAYPDQLARSARNELAGHIVPSTMLDKPIAPNFFLEVKGPDGNAAVATRQARYDGAVGSRAMHSLQNYGEKEPKYDNNAHTFTSTYHDGQLKLYAHHVTAPATEGGRPEYHMTQLRTFGMTDTRETCVEGMGALRNTLDLAERRRNDFIRAANVRTTQMVAAAGQERTTAEIQPPEDEKD